MLCMQDHCCVRYVLLTSNNCSSLFACSYTSLHYTVTHFLPTGIPSWPSLPPSRAPYCCMVCSKLVASRGPEYFLHCRAKGKCAPYIPCLSPFRLPSGSQPHHRHWHCELFPACSVALHTAYTIHSEKCTI